MRLVSGSQFGFLSASPVPTPLPSLGPLCAEALTAQHATTAVETTSADATLPRAVWNVTFYPPCSGTRTAQPIAGREPLPGRGARRAGRERVRGFNSRPPRLLATS